VATDAELGFRRPRQAGADAVDRKTFLKATLGAGAGALLTPNAMQGSDADLARMLSAPTTNYRQMESAVPSGQLAPVVEAHLALALGIVNERMRTSAGYQVLSEVAGLSAWLAVDRGDTASARRRYAEAIDYAERTRHPLLVSYMTASLGAFAVEAGNPRAGLTMIQRASALVGDDVPDAARAWLESLRAAAHAELGDRPEAATALSRAERLANRSRGELRWPWVFDFDSAKVARYQAGVLGRLGDVRAASAAYAAAGPALTAAKPRALAQVDHAHVLARGGDVASACALAVEALGAAQAYGSERITNRIRVFRASLPTRTTEAGNLDDELAALYERGN
jgi:tetratricopeptide (TPR) repeat protein